MKYLKQFSIILFISLLGEILHSIVPLPMPASIYGLAILFTALSTGIIPLEEVRETGRFLIEVMPLMFIPAAVGLLGAYHTLMPVLVPYVVITLVSTLLVMLVAGRVTQAMKERSRPMSEFMQNSVFWGVALSFVAYGIGMLLQRKFHRAIFNPLLISVILIMVFLGVSGTDYRKYQEGANVISYFLTPATVCLAIPLYEQIELLKKNFRAIMVGILSGVLTSLCSVLAMSVFFGLNHKEYATLLPKSITTAIGMGVSEELGGYVTLTVAIIIITGILGSVLAETACRIFKITEPVARGVAIGTASHAIGTSKAMEMGETEGAISGLSIAVAGLLTVVGASVFSCFL